MPHYYMFHKPFGCVTARRDDRYPTVMAYFKLETGVILKGADTLTAPAKITVTGHAVMSDILSTLPEEIQKDIHKNRPDHPITYGIITISEGKKRQIRRMMKSVHCCVIELKRISIGDIVLDKALCPGEWKEIFPHT